MVENQDCKDCQRFISAKEEIQYVKGDMERLRQEINNLKESDKEMNDIIVEILKENAETKIYYKLILEKLDELKYDYRETKIQLDTFKEELNNFKSSKIEAKDNGIINKLFVDSWLIMFRMFVLIFITLCGYKIATIDLSMFIK